MIQKLKVKEVAAAETIGVAEVDVAAVMEAKVEITTCQIIKIPDIKRQ